MKCIRMFVVWLAFTASIGGMLWLFRISDFTYVPGTYQYLLSSLLFGATVSLAIVVCIEKEIEKAIKENIRFVRCSGTENKEADDV